MRYWPSIVLLMLIVECQAQSTMLIEQLSSRIVERENFDKNGTLLNRQRFEGGSLRNANGFLELEVTISFFDQQNKLTDRYSTIYRCKPESSNVLVMAFPFSNPKSKVTEISSNSSTFKELYDLDILGDIEIELLFNSGLMNFFGSKSIIRIFNRKLESEGSEKVLSSSISIKTYALGIRVKNLNYSLMETLTEKNLLSFQQFTEADGSYFTLTYR